MYLQKSFRAAVLKDKDHLVGKPTTECLAVSKTVCFQIFPDRAFSLSFLVQLRSPKKGKSRGFNFRNDGRVSQRFWSGLKRGARCSRVWDVHCGEPPQRGAGDSHRGNCRNKSPGTVCHNLEYHDNDTNIFQRSIFTPEECVL